MFNTGHELSSKDFCFLKLFFKEHGKTVFTLGSDYACKSIAQKKRDWIISV